jgi:hypothetical protein
MLSDADMYERMEKGWRGGKPETVCGNGSLLVNTAKARTWLPDVVKRFDIHSLCDAGAGDQWWIQHLVWNISYTPYDLIPRSPHIHKLDITREAMQPCDAILCRMVLNHLDAERIMMAIPLFRQSARYLIATQFPRDQPQRSIQFARLDLRHEPYNLGEPIEQVQDGGEPNCTLALWSLS